MVELAFETLTFRDNLPKGVVEVSFLRLFGFELLREELERIGKFTLNGGVISFEGVSEHHATTKFNRLLAQGFLTLKNRLLKKKAVYIHRNSGIPLFGHLAFGIIDRGTNVIEVKPITSCNIRCVYCSVNEDIRPVDFVVEKEYLVGEFRKLVAFKNVEGIDAHINSQGEPMLYADMLGLVKDISATKGVTNISIDTNATVLSDKSIDALADAGLTQVNLSLNAIDPKKAKEVADAPYDVERIKKLAHKIASRMKLVIAPVWVPGLNDNEIPKIIEFAKTLPDDFGKPRVCIQNFLNYRFGRNPGKEMPFEKFFEKLKELEKSTGVKLIIDAKDFNIFPTKELPKPFRKGQLVEVEVVGDGRLRNEKLGVAKGRCIAIINGNTSVGKAKVKITRTKHNIFCGVEVGS